MENIFISATSADLREERRRLTELVVQMGCHPVVQEAFEGQPHSTTVSDMLERKVAGCAAMVHLCGFYFGSGPHEVATKRCSYTQLEYLLARDVGIPVFVGLADEKTYRQTCPQQPEADADLQLQHYRCLQTTDNIYYPFRDFSDIVPAVASFLRSIGESAQKRSSGDLRGTERVHYIHVPEQPSHFVGRLFELDQLTQRLRNPNPSLIAVVGIAGQGKTTLVAEWLRRTTEWSFDRCVWCHAHRDAFTFDQFLDAALSTLLQNKFDKREMRGVQMRTSRLIRAMQDERVLLIIDSLEQWLRGWAPNQPERVGRASTGERAGYFEGLDDFLRQLSGLENGSHLILTSRALPQALDDVQVAVVPVYEQAWSVGLRGLHPTEAEQLLRLLRVQGDSARIRALSAQYGDHPLALMIVGRFVDKRLGGNLDRLPAFAALDPRGRLFGVLDEIRKDLSASPQIERFVQVASLAEVNPSLQVVRAGLEALDPSSRAGEIDAQNWAADLADWNLLSWDPADQTVAIHPVIKQHFARMLSDHEARAVHAGMARTYDRQPIAPDAATLKQVESRMLAIVHNVRAGLLEQAQALCFEPVGDYTFAEWLSAWGHQGRGVELLTIVSEHASDHPTATLLAMRAGMQRQLMRTASALTDLNAAIACFETLSSSLTPEGKLDFAGALMNRGNVHRDLLHIEALRDYATALAKIDEIRDLRLFVPKLAQKAAVLLNRSNMYFDVGNLSDALVDADTAIELYQRLAGLAEIETRPQLAAALESRAIALSGLDRAEQACQSITAAIKVYDELVRSGRKEFALNLAHCRTNFAVALSEVGKNDDALSCFDQSISALQGLVSTGRQDASWQLGLAHMDCGIALLQLGRLQASLTASMRAADLFKGDTTSEPRLQGWMGHALANAAEAQHAIGEEVAAMDLWDRGLKLLLGLVGEGRGGNAVFLRKSASAALALRQAHEGKAKKILAVAVHETERALDWKIGTEALAIECRHALGLFDRIDFAKEGAVFGELIDRLRACLVSQLPSNIGAT